MSKPKKRRAKMVLSKPLWQKAKAVKRENGNRARLILGLVVLALLILMVVTGFVFRALTSGVRQGDEQFSLLVGGEGGRLLLISLDKTAQKVLVLDFDPEVMVSTVYGYGDYKVGSLLKLGKIEKLGSELLIKSVQNTVGLVVADYLPMRVRPDEQVDADFIKSLAKPMYWSVMGKPLGVADVWWFTRSTAGLRDDQVEVVTVHESRLAYTQTLPDGSQVYKIDQQRFDGFIAHEIEGLIYSAEALGVAIVNTTPHPGLASSLSRLLLNSGVDVTSVSENQEALAESQIWVKTHEMGESQTTGLIRKIFAMGERETGGEEYRAEIVVFLGEDYYRYLSKHPDR